MPDDEIVKGYEISDGKYVTLTAEEIAAAHVEGDKVIEIHDFVPLEEIDPIVFERTYYLGPAEGAERVYALLAQALETSGLVGIASFVFHDRDQLACLRVKDGGLLLERMYFADEIRDGDGILPDRKRTVDKRELKLAVDLIERMKGTFDHSAYHDRYRERLMAIINKKRKGETITAPKVKERNAPADLMAALEASLGEAVERRKPKGSRARQEGRSKTADLSRGTRPRKRQGAAAERTAQGGAAEPSSTLRVAAIVHPPWRPWLNLEEYRAKRNAGKTPEPLEARRKRKRGDPMFVVQRHSARRLHYDLRLERDGVLLSWALPRGVPLRGGERALAVHVEDHPLEYADVRGRHPGGRVRRRLGSRSGTAARTRSCASAPTARSR